MSTYTTLHEYEGWSNVFTWTVALQIDNSETWQTRWLNEAITVLVKHVGLKTQVYALSQSLQDWAEELLYGVESNSDARLFRNDMLDASLAFVNWDEIAEHLLTKAPEFK